jgi:hypothetical protein
MIRLLHRLASRALGAAPEIRPIVGWSAPAPGFDAVPHAQEPHRTESAGSAASPLAAAAPAGPTAASRAVSRLRDAEVAGAPARHTPDASGRDVGRVRELDDAAAPAAPVAGPHAAVARALDVSFEVAPAPHASHAERQRNAAAEDTAPSRDSRAHPDPLLPPPRPAAQSALPPAANAGRVASVPARAAREATEVHVTIGRIELTAVHEAPRPRREPARARGPQSLDEYLARREAKRP